jgi:hypothetical protein
MRGALLIHLRDLEMPEHSGHVLEVRRVPTVIRIFELAEPQFEFTLAQDTSHVDIARRRVV